MITSFSQHDPRWSDICMSPTCSKPPRINELGCLIAAVASVLYDYGVDTDPARLYAWLKSHNGFYRQTYLIFDAVRALGVGCATIVDCENTPAPTAMFTDWLTCHGAIVAQVDRQPGGILEPHWLRLLSLTSTDAQVMDPAQKPGAEIIALSTKYYRKNWTPARAIFRAVLYRRIDE